MDRSKFWEMIEDLRDEGVTDGDELAEALQVQLAEYSPQDILAWYRVLRRLVTTASTERMWGAGYLMAGGLSDDGFEYFLGWLISRGQSIYEAALEDPDSLAEHVSADDDEFECESILYVANEAYEEAHGGELEDIMDEDVDPAPDIGNDLDFEDEEQMKEEFPQLWEKFGDKEEQ